MTDLQNIFVDAHSRLQNTLNETIESCAHEVEQAFNIINSTLQSGNKLIACGNGGSAATAQHFTAELIGRYKKERGALPALSLTVDTSALTAIANDYSYDDVFVRQLSGLGNTGDVLVGFSTSGKSPNVLKALELAQEAGIHTIFVTGNMDTVETLPRNLSAHIMVPTNETARIQEVHDFIIHVWCEALDNNF